MIAGVALFAADDGPHGAELWVSDGTESGTYLLQDIAPDGDSSDPGGFTLVGDQIFFSADDGSHGRELWAMPLSALSDAPRRRAREPRVVPDRLLIPR